MMTTRQHEVFACLTMGDTDAEIAMRLECAPATVRRQVARILEVVGVTRREELVCAEARPHGAAPAGSPTDDPAGGGGGGRECGRSAHPLQSV